MSESEDLVARLSPFERKFAEEYAGNCNGNGVRACQAAGHTGDYGVLATTAYRLLRKVEVREYLVSLQENDERIAGRIERLRFLTAVVRGEETEKRPERDSEGNVSMVDCPPALRDRLAAQEALSKLAGEQVTKVAHTDSQGNDVSRMSDAELMAMVALGKREE